MISEVRELIHFSFWKYRNLSDASCKCSRRDNPVVIRQTIFLVFLYNLSIYLSICLSMRRAAWGGRKPGHISVFQWYACETTATGRRQPNHIHSDGFFPYKYFVPGWTRTRMEEVCSSVVKYSASTDLAIPAPDKVFRAFYPFWIFPSYTRGCKTISSMTSGRQIR